MPQGTCPQSRQRGNCPKSKPPTIPIRREGPNAFAHPRRKRNLRSQDRKPPRQRHLSGGRAQSQVQKHQEHLDLRRSPSCAIRGAFRPLSSTRKTWPRSRRPTILPGERLIVCRTPFWRTAGPKIRFEARPRSGRGGKGTQRHRQPGRSLEKRPKEGKLPPN